MGISVREEIDFTSDVLRPRSPRGKSRHDDQGILILFEARPRSALWWTRIGIRITMEMGGTQIDRDGVP